MNIAIKRIKNSPYKLVVTQNADRGQIVGIFDNGKYIEQKHFNQKYHAIAAEWVAEQIKGH